MQRFSGFCFVFFFKETRKMYKNKPVGHGLSANGPVGMQSALCLYSFTYICSQKCALVGLRVRCLPEGDLCDVVLLNQR